MKKGNTTGLEKWRKHLEECRKSNPKKSLKECMFLAKKTYRK